MSKLLDWDASINIGDFVYSTYNKSTLLYQVSDIERRFIRKEDLPYYEKGSVKIGDEYNPLVTIKPIGNLNPLVKKFKKTPNCLDGSYLVKLTKNSAQELIDSLAKELSVVK